LANEAVILENVSKSFHLEKKTGLLKTFKGVTYHDTTKKFLKALDEISLIALKGEILGIIGLNGSGKTTLLRIIAGIYQPDSGTVRTIGRVSPLLQLGTGFQNELDAGNNIILNGMLMGISKPEIEKKIGKIIEYAGLENFQGVRLKHYSSGMRARLAFSIALEVESDILLVDEVLAVGDAVFRKKSFESFLSLKNEQKTIFIATHNLNVLSKFCDRVILLDRGTIIKIGKPDEIMPLYDEITKNKKNKNL